MVQATLQKIFKRDWEKLRSEIEQYTNEDNLWKTDGTILNSGGNLCLHLVGNLNTFIGATLGNTGYIRDRDAEFSLKNVPKIELIQQIDALIPIVEKSLSNLNSRMMEEEYPVTVFKEKTTTEYFLIHLATHLGYHLGQINYHRRLLDV